MCLHSILRVRGEKEKKINDGSLLTAGATQIKWKSNKSAEIDWVRYSVYLDDLGDGVTWTFGLKNVYRRQRGIPRLRWECAHIRNGMASDAMRSDATPWKKIFVRSLSIAVRDNIFYCDTILSHEKWAFQTSAGEIFSDFAIFFHSFFLYSFDRHGTHHHQHGKQSAPCAERTIYASRKDNNIILTLYLKILSLWVRTA